MSERDYILLLEDMLEAASKIQLYTKNYTSESFCEDEKTIDAVVRNFEIIGEAANRIHPDYRIQYSQIAWNRIRGFRNRIIHEYFGIDYDIVWSIIISDIPKLITDLKNIIDDLKTPSEK